MENVYGAPAGDGFPGTNPKEAVSLPAILLMVTSAVTFLWALTNMATPVGPEQLDQIYNDPNLARYRDAIDQNRETIEWFVSMGGRLATFGPVVLLNALTFFGAFKMRQLQSRGLAMAGAIASLVPCCGTCGCLALPISIWALVVLAKPEVKAAFR
ncbi:hypothetical protein HUA74_24900 [Myxococcus sp. CA051A]|uniref:Uncharacterized protein n=1 Tax=Myxococcus llanfairpwllgwyngyllgogerychwyrndrobwllllantysiliogogogochensis TaxID=2590453 RepID=A0A540X5Q7_9BACT|nr:MULTISPECIES: hypothetical protein [Myxococcus]NTX04829.1 hypothetical protein [Myxococcus sp. CA040A]NTX36174.1 hypothetical protein [Myxococcus sp. CA033]NTX63903.1 hypothetical protein [Myxococcus sp. CA051A]TQF16064.1 hypothetical protein FJV41_10335 [Myxococcus llanfairpwllgwyngyllgogerychwyrndrobwllllantysiliogogogochensis]